jgi:S-adenosylmethionine/arginine decarboxylase-like enzyme
VKDHKLTLRMVHLDPDLIARAIDEIGLRPLAEVEKRWEPHGYTWCGWGVDFQLIIHTWPEHQLATIDLWLESAKSEPVIVALELALGWRRVEERSISRGSLDRARTAPFGGA